MLDYYSFPLADPTLAAAVPGTLPWAKNTCICKNIVTLIPGFCKGIASVVRHSAFVFEQCQLHEVS